MAKAKISGLLGQLQKLQEEVARVEAELENIEVEGTAGGGMVTVVASGRGDIKRVIIDPEVVNPEDVEMLEDLIAAAANQAIEKSRRELTERLSKVAGGILPQLPGGLPLTGF